MSSALRSITTALLIAPAVAAAQIPVPKALLFPNYDNVLVGKNQALEGGAYIARTNDASANFYNPAGLVAAEKTSLNASSTGYVYSKITSKASGESISSSKLEGVPGYFGVVLEPPFTDTRSWRIGFAVTRSVSWSPGGIDQSIGQSASGFDRLTYATEATFGTQVYQLAGAWAPVKALRLGVSAGLATTSFKSNVMLSGAQSPEGTPGQFMSTLRTDGSDSSVVFALGAQWDLGAGVTIGALVRPPGVRIGMGGSVVTAESSLVQGVNSTFTYFRDEDGTFQYKLPLEASAGVAYRRGPLELELDLRFHDQVSPYDFYKSEVPYQVLTETGGVPVRTTAAAPSIKYEARRVYNAAFGGNWHVSKLLTAHGGFYLAQSPVAEAATSPLRNADLYGVTGGVDFQLEKFGASIGGGYQWGTSKPTGIALGGGTVTASEVKLQSISILYAISYQF